jgi:hypothetical protein
LVLDEGFAGFSFVGRAGGWYQEQLIRNLLPSVWCGQGDQDIGTGEMLRACNFDRPELRCARPDEFRAAGPTQPALALGEAYADATITDVAFAKELEGSVVDRVEGAKDDRDLPGDYAPKSHTPASLSS